MKIEVSIIIVNYNTKQLTLDCLKSIYEYTANVEFEVILIDNASVDDSVEEIRNIFPFVKVIESNKNLGFGKANNLGAEHALGEMLLFLNSDTILINNSVKILYDFLIQNPDAGVCGGNLVDININPATSFSVSKPSVCSDIDYFFFNIFSKLIYKNIYYNYSSKPMKIYGSISGADYMVRKEVFDDVGGFDKDFFMYYEETELSYRIIKKGYNIYNVPSVKIIHLEGASEVVKEKSLDRTLISKKIYYQKTSSLFLYYLSNFIFFLTIIQRMSIFRLIGNKKKYLYWLSFYKWSLVKLQKNINN